MPIKLTDIGANVTVRAGTPLVVVAGGAADNVEQSGPWVNRNPLLDTGLPALSPRIEGPYESAVLCFILDATLAAGVTLTFGGKVRTAAAADGSGAADYGDPIVASVVATGPTGGGRVIAVVRTSVKFDLSTAGGFVGYRFTANLSTAAVDTVTVTPFWVFGGGDVVPVV